MNPLVQVAQAVGRTFFVVVRRGPYGTQYRAASKDTPWRPRTVADAQQHSSLQSALVELIAAIEKGNDPKTTFIQKISETITPGVSTLDLSTDLCGPAKGFVVITKYSGDRTYPSGDVVIASIKRDSGGMNGHGHLGNYWKSELPRFVFPTLQEAMTAIAAVKKWELPFSHIARVVETTTPGTTKVTTETLKFVDDEHFPQHVAR